MKEATGELNMTVVTIIAIGAIIAFFWIMWPRIQRAINGSWEDIANEDGDNHQIIREVQQNQRIIVPSIW